VCWLITSNKEGLYLGLNAEACALQGGSIQPARNRSSLSGMPVAASMALQTSVMSVAGVGIHLVLDTETGADVTQVLIA
jgi:hypothetical protein